MTTLPIVFDSSDFNDSCFYGVCLLSLGFCPERRQPRSEPLRSAAAAAAAGRPPAHSLDQASPGSVAQKRREREDVLLFCPREEKDSFDKR
jgi:hypothetical protein